MNTNLWANNYFDKEESVPSHWICPYCNQGHLDLTKFDFSETKESKSNRKAEEWEPSRVEYRFSGVLKCTNFECLDETYFIGKGSDDEDFNADGDVIKMITFFEPTYFQPTLKLFQVPRKADKKIKREIEKAFSLYWSDIDACANKIRKTVELLMDVYKIPRFEIKKSKRRLTLHKRIDRFKNKNQKFEKLANRLLAIKWIGNDGSHPGELTIQNVLLAFELLESCVEKTYEDREARLDKAAKAINKQGGKTKKRSGIFGRLKKTANK